MLMVDESDRQPPESSASEHLDCEAGVFETDPMVLAVLLILIVTTVVWVLVHVEPESEVDHRHMPIRSTAPQAPTPTQPPSPPSQTLRWQPGQRT